MFYKKILNIVNQKDYDEIIHDHFLIWHFLRNQENDTLFSDIIKKIVPTIIEDKEWEEQKIDGSNKRKLIEYLEKFWNNHTDEVIDVLIEMNKKARTPNIKRRIGMSIEKLQKPLSLDKLFDLASSLLQETDSMVRDFTVRSLQKFVDDFSIDQNKELIELMFFNKVNEDDVVQANTSMQIRFQGKDLVNSSFRESAKYLWLVLQNTKFTIEIIELFMNIYDHYLSEDLPKQDTKRSIKYHFTRWLDNEWFGHDVREYESDPKKRLALELRDWLKELMWNHDIFQEVASYIIDRATYIGYYEILIRVLDSKEQEYPAIVKQIIMNPDVLMEVDTQKKTWHTFIRNYLSNNSWDIEQYVTVVDSMKIDDNKDLETYNKAWAYFALPEPRWEEVEKYINMFKEQIIKEHNLTTREMKVSEEPDIQVKTYREDDKKIDTERFNEERSIEDLIEKIVEYNKKDTMFFNWSQIFNAYSDYFKTHKEQLTPFYTTIKTDHIELLKEWFASYLSQGQIDMYKEELKNDKQAFYKKMIELYDLFDNDRTAKLNIARAIETNEYLRAKDTGEMKEELLADIKKFVLKISQDKDPENEESNWFSVMLNSVRGLWTILISILAHYYPEDKELLEQIRTLSKDPLIGIRAATVENLVYLISKNYPFCQEIIKQFESDRDPIIDQSFIRFLFRLGNEKLKANLSIIEAIAKNEDKDVRDQLWVLIWQAYTHKVEMDDIVNKLISWSLGDVNTVHSFANQIENEIPHILLFPDRKDMIEPVLLCYNRLLTDYKPEDPEHRLRIANRLSYLFYDEKLPVKEFEIFDTHKIFETLIEHGEMTGQSNLNKYLLRCLRDNIDLSNRIAELLKKQITKHEIILSDDYHGKSVADIVEYILSQGKGSVIVDEVFDEGLKYGSKYFYDIFDKYYKDKD